MTIGPESPASDSGIPSSPLPDVKPKPALLKQAPSSPALKPAPADPTKEKENQLEVRLRLLFFIFFFFFFFPNIFKLSRQRKRELRKFPKGRRRTRSVLK